MTNKKWNHIDGLMSSKLKDDMKGDIISNSDSDISDDGEPRSDTTQHNPIKISKINHGDVHNNIVGCPNYSRLYVIQDDFSQTENEESTEIVVAETNFFNAKNKEFGESLGETKDLRPYDFPFVRRLLQRIPIETLTVDDVIKKEQKFQTIEAVTRAYENEYLREPVGDERPCVFGFNCQGLTIEQAADNRFILREFLLPSEEEEFKKTNQYPIEHRMCVMCKRNEIARALINIKADAMGVRDDCIMQDYRNIVETDGEYCLSDCIVSNPQIYQGLIDPVVLHARSMYRLEIKEGIKYYIQYGLSYPEDKSANNHFL